MIIQSKCVWTGETFSPLQLEIKAEKIISAHPWNSKEYDKDYGNLKILPGFIDVHTHGAYGFDTNDADTDGLRYWISHIPGEGVTSILPTTVTQSKAILQKAVKNVADVISKGYAGAEILGIHFEGPYLDTAYKGAQPEECIKRADVEEFKEYCNCANGHIKYITLAPERDKICQDNKLCSSNMILQQNAKMTYMSQYHELIKYCKSNNIKVSLGHSSADYDEAIQAADCGAVSVTHVYNGMAPFHHRNPGLLGAALTDDRLYGEIICDGFHSHTAAINIFFKCKGADNAIMITDSLCAKYGKSGERYQLGGHDIYIDENGLARLCEDNTIAGSTLKMNEGLRIAIEKAKVPEKYAINACTINPARMLEIDDRKGKLQAGYDADITILDESYNVIETYCKGSVKNYE